MTTVINTPSGNDSNSGGWMVLVIVLILVIAGGAFWFLMGNAKTPAAPTVNVTLPTPAAATAP